MAPVAVRRGRRGGRQTRKRWARRTGRGSDRMVCADGRRRARSAIVGHRFHPRCRIVLHRRSPPIRRCTRRPGRRYTRRRRPSAPGDGLQRCLVEVWRRPSPPLASRSALPPVGRPTSKHRRRRCRRQSPRRCSRRRAPPPAQVAGPAVATTLRSRRVARPPPAQRSKRAGNQPPRPRAPKATRGPPRRESRLSPPRGLDRRHCRYVGGAGAAQCRNGRGWWRQPTPGLPKR